MDIFSIARKETGGVHEYFIKKKKKSANQNYKIYKEIQQKERQPPPKKINNLEVNLLQVTLENKNSLGKISQISIFRILNDI